MNHSGGKKQGRGDKPVHRSQSASHERRPGKDSEDRSVSSSGNHDNSRKKHNSNGPHGHGRSGGRGGGRQHCTNSEIVDVVHDEAKNEEIIGCSLEDIGDLGGLALSKVLDSLNNNKSPLTSLVGQFTPGNCPFCSSHTCQDGDEEESTLVKSLRRQIRELEEDNDTLRSNTSAAMNCDEKLKLQKDLADLQEKRRQMIQVRRTSHADARNRQLVTLISATDDASKAALDWLESVSIRERERQHNRKVAEKRTQENEATQLQALANQIQRHQQQRRSLSLTALNPVEGASLSTEQRLQNILNDVNRSRESRRDAETHRRRRYSEEEDVREQCEFQLALTLSPLQVQLCKHIQSQRCQNLDELVRFYDQQEALWTDAEDTLIRNVSSLLQGLDKSANDDAMRELQTAELALTQSENEALHSLKQRIRANQEKRNAAERELAARNDHALADLRRAILTQKDRTLQSLQQLSHSEQHKEDLRRIREDSELERRFSIGVPSRGTMAPSTAAEGVRLADKARRAHEQFEELLNLHDDDRQRSLNQLVSDANEAIDMLRPPTVGQSDHPWNSLLQSLSLTDSEDSVSTLFGELQRERADKNQQWLTRRQQTLDHERDLQSARERDSKSLLDKLSMGLNAVNRHVAKTLSEIDTLKDAVYAKTNARIDSLLSSVRDDKESSDDTDSNSEDNDDEEESDVEFHDVDDVPASRTIAEKSATDVISSLGRFADQTDEERRSSDELPSPEELKKQIKDAASLLKALTPAPPTPGSMTLNQDDNDVKALLKAVPQTPIPFQNVTSVVAVRQAMTGVAVATGMDPNAAIKSDPNVFTVKAVINSQFTAALLSEYYTEIVAGLLQDLTEGHALSEQQSVSLMEFRIVRDSSNVLSAQWRYRITSITNPRSTISADTVPWRGGTSFPSIHGAVSQALAIMKSTAQLSGIMIAQPLREGKNAFELKAASMLEHFVEPLRLSLSTTSDVDECLLDTLEDFAVVYAATPDSGVSVVLVGDVLEVHGSPDHRLKFLAQLGCYYNALTAEDVLESDEDNEAIAQLFKTDKPDGGLWDQLYIGAVNYVADHTGFDPQNVMQVATIRINPELRRNCPVAQSFMHGLLTTDKECGSSVFGGSSSLAIPKDLVKHGVFGFHGTRNDSAVKGISHSNFDPNRRSGQAFGPGEYFAKAASYSQGGYWGDTQTLFVSFILRNRLLNDCYHFVMNNPAQSKMYCLPVLLLTFDEKEPIDVRCSHDDEEEEVLDLWEWKDDDGWKVYGTGQKDDVTWWLRELNTAYSVYSDSANTKGQVIHVKIVRLLDGRLQEYGIDFKAMRQTNRNTGFTREMRRTPRATSSFNNDTLRVAAKLWCTDRAAAMKRYGHISKWNTSKVTSMQDLFGNMPDFNDNINDWDVSQVTNISGMFLNVKAFNQPLDKWRVSNVVYAWSVFAGADNFNQPLNSWDTRKMTITDSMFATAGSFNQPLDKWNLSNVAGMSAMFQAAQAFNQPLNSWNVSKVDNMGFMFAAAYKFNQPLDRWNVAKVTDMRSMFNSAVVFNQRLDCWNVSKVECMEDMFSGAQVFSFLPELKSKWHHLN